MAAASYSIEFMRTIEEPWTGLEPVYLGKVPRGLGTPDFFVQVEKDGKPFRCLYVYGGEAASAKALIWKEWAVVLFGAFISFVGLNTGTIRQYEMDHYVRQVGRLYPQNGLILATSNQGIYCFDTNANQLWQNIELAEEWVEIEKVEDNIISGWSKLEAPSVITWEESDAKEEFIPFKVNLTTGQTLQLGW